MKNLIILQGAQGSGKSTLAKKIQTKYPEFQIISTDEYWGPDYNFEMSKLGIAHRWNQDRCRNLCISGCSIIVDNTNKNMKEIKPYLDLAKEYGYFVTVMRPNNPWSYDAVQCFQRNTHKVPLETIQRTISNTDMCLQEKVNDYMVG